MYFPNEVYTLETLPKKSIALDGIIVGTRIDSFLEKYSFDHHYTGIPRHAQSSTAKQIYDALMLGWKPPTKNGYSYVYFSDVDLDCMISIFLLTLGNKKKITKRIKEWVEVINSVDIFGPAYIFNDEKSEKIKDFLYYSILRKHKGKNSISIITSILNNLWHYYEKDNITYAYHTKKAAKKLYIVEHSNFIYPQRPTRDLTLMAILSEDPVFEYAYKKGADIVIGIREKPNNKYKYSIAKRNDFVPFSITELLNILSEREAGWGGGSTIIGSPEIGSDIAPDVLLFLIKRGQWKDETTNNSGDAETTPANNRCGNNSGND